MPIFPPIAGKSIIIKGKTVELRGRSPQGIWSTSDSTVATVDPWGVVKGLAEGTATITYTESNSFGCRTDSTLAVKVTTKTVIEFNPYPNPASRLLNIAYKKSAVKTAEMSITNITGHSVYKGVIDMPSSSGILQFDVTGIPDGVYTVSITSADGDFVGRVVIKE